MNTAITWQWLEGGVLYVVGNEDGDPMLYQFLSSQDTWQEESIDDFHLGPGASIAYRPNPDMAPLYPIPGWLYCLAGDGRQFLRYNIPTSLEDQTVDASIPAMVRLLPTRRQTSSGLKSPVRASIGCWLPTMSTSTPAR